MSATLGRGRGVPTAGRAAPAPTELRDWLRAGMRQEVLGGALQNIGTLVQDSTLEVSHDIDFGQCSLSKHQLPPDEHISMQARAAQVPKLQVRLHATCRQRAALRVCLRSIHVLAYTDALTFRWPQAASAC